MVITYSDIKSANDTIKTTEIQKKQYAEVNQRIKAFRMVYPTGTISTEMVSNENGVCIFRATVGFNNEEGYFIKLGNGTAYEKEGSTFINKTSYIENAETSAVGRALGMAGFGIDVSVASAEEVANAIANQTEEVKKATPKQIEYLKSVYEGENLQKLLKAQNVEKIEDIPLSVASDLIGKIKKKAEETK